MLNTKSATTGQRRIRLHVLENILKFNNDSKWDIDLKFGQSHEKKIAKLLGLKVEEIEVKTERDWWYKTGNVCIEIEREGKPTGLSCTEAKVWVHVFAIDKKQMMRLVIDVPVLKKLVKKYKDNWKMVGDGRRTKAIFIPFGDIIYEIAKLN